MHCRPVRDRGSMLHAARHFDNDVEYIAGFCYNNLTTKSARLSAYVDLRSGMPTHLGQMQSAHARPMARRLVWNLSPVVEFHT
jgi:hypothetical protein